MLKSPQDSNHESHFLKLNSFKLTIPSDTDILSTISNIDPNSQLCFQKCGAFPAWVKKKLPSWQARQELAWMPGKFFSSKAKSFREPGRRRCSLQSLSHFSHKHPGGQKEENTPWNHFKAFSEMGQHSKELLLSPVRANREHMEEFHQWHLTAWCFLRDCSLLSPPLPREHFLLLR